MKRRALLGTFAAVAALPGAARAQAWPAKSIRFIVPYIPGSAPDVLARTLADRLGSGLGQSLVIENRPGAGGNIGTEMIAKAPADGYAIGLGTSAITTNPWLYRKIAYDPVNDFAAINLCITMPHLLVVAADSPVKSVAELTRDEKLRLFQRLANELARDTQATTIPANVVPPIWSPYDSYEAAATLAAALRP